MMYTDLSGIPHPPQTPNQRSQLKRTSEGRSEIAASQAKLHELLAAKRRESDSQEAAARFTSSVQKAAGMRREEEQYKVSSSDYLH